MRIVYTIQPRIIDGENFASQLLSRQGASAPERRWRARRNVQRTVGADRRGQYLSARLGSPSHAVERCSRQGPMQEGGNEAYTDPMTHGSISPVCIYVSLTDWPCVLVNPQGWRSCARGTATSDRDRLRASPLGGFPGCPRIANVGRARVRARAGCTPSAARGSQTYTCGKESNRVPS